MKNYVLMVVIAFIGVVQPAQASWWDWGNKELKKQREKPWKQKPGKEGIDQFKDHYGKGYQWTRDLIGAGVATKAVFDAIKEVVADKKENERLTQENQDLKDKLKEQEDRQIPKICCQCARPTFEHKDDKN